MVTLDRHAEVLLPASYACAGHLDHGYALTAHRAQGATVDRAFVLGSDELYREWGYTALSRHRLEARFYVTAAVEFLNEPPPALQPSGASGRAARLLAGSRSERLALEAQEAVRNVSAFERAHERLAHADARLEALAEERAAIGLLRRGRRRELDGLIGRWQGERHRRELELGRLESAQPAARHPRPGRAEDPLRALGRDREALDRARSMRDRSLGREL